MVSHLHFMIENTANRMPPMLGDGGGAAKYKGKT